MEAFEQLIKIDWWIVFFGAIVALIAFKSLWLLLEWFVCKFGIETKSHKQRREDHDLLVLTANNLSELQKRHTNDEETFRKNLNNYIEESKKDREALHDEMTKFSEDRIHDREQSLKIQKDLTDSIKAIAERQDNRDAKISDLSEMVLEKQISDYRWEIIQLADEISNGKEPSKECLKHAISTGDKYEKIIEKYGLINGEVSISLEIIHKAYKTFVEK